MDNLRFLEELMNSEAEYWVVRHSPYVSPYNRSSFNKNPESVYFIGVGYEELGDRPRLVDEMTVRDLKSINGKHIRANIPLSENYPPFQYGLRISDFDAGFPVEKSINAFLDLCRISDKPDDWWGYKELYEKAQELEAAKGETEQGKEDDEQDA